MPTTLRSCPERRSAGRRPLVLLLLSLLYLVAFTALLAEATGASPDLALIAAP